MPVEQDRFLTPARGRPAQPSPAAESRWKLNVAVVFTSIPATSAALRIAALLAQDLGGRITLLAPRVVPYPLPLTRPPVLTGWNEARFRAIASQSPVEIRAVVCLCRDRLQMLMAELRPRSLVVVGGRKRWWPTPEQRLARALRRAGHEVVFTETE